MKSQEHKIRQMLDDIGRALVQAINGSSRISGTIREIRQEGFSVHLVLGYLNEPATASRETTDAPEAASREAPARETVATPASPQAVSPQAVSPKAVSPKAVSPKAASPAASPKAASPKAKGRKPSFRLNSEDVSFLRSIGIDPTRPPRRRRKPGSPA